MNKLRKRVKSISKKLFPVTLSLVLALYPTAYLYADETDPPVELVEETSDVNTEEEMKEARSETGYTINVAANNYYVQMSSTDQATIGTFANYTMDGKDPVISYDSTVFENNTVVISTILSYLGPEGMQVLYLIGGVLLLIGFTLFLSYREKHRY